MKYPATYDGKGAFSAGFFFPDSSHVQKEDLMYISTLVHYVKGTDSQHLPFLLENSSLRKGCQHPRTHSTFPENPRPWLSVLILFF